MPKAFPEEICRDVVAVARKGEALITSAEKLRCLTVSPSPLDESGIQRGGMKPGAVSGESAKLRKANRRIRLLDQEFEVMRHAVASLFLGINSKNDVHPQAGGAPTAGPRAGRQEHRPSGFEVAASCCGIDFLRTSPLPVGRQSHPVPGLGRSVPINAAIAYHREGPAFGCRFIADGINEGLGLAARECRIRRLCSENGIASGIYRWRRSGLKIGPPVQNNLIERDFSATVPNRK